MEAAEGGRRSVGTVRVRFARDAIARSQCGLRKLRRQGTGSSVAVFNFAELDSADWHMYKGRAAAQALREQAAEACRYTGPSRNSRSGCIFSSQNLRVQRRVASSIVHGLTVASLTRTRTVHTANECHTTSMRLVPSSGGSLCSAAMSHAAHGAGP